MGNTTMPEALDAPIQAAQQNLDRDQPRNQGKRSEEAEVEAIGQDDQEVERARLQHHCDGRRSQGNPALLRIAELFENQES